MTAYDSIPLIRKKVNPNIRVRWCGGLFRSQAFSSHNCHVQVCSIFVIEQFQLKTKECSVIFKNYGWENLTWVGLHRLSPRKVLSFPFSSTFVSFSRCLRTFPGHIFCIFCKTAVVSQVFRKKGICAGNWREAIGALDPLAHAQRLTAVLH